MHRHPLFGVSVAALGSLLWLVIPSLMDAVVRHRVMDYAFQAWSVLLLALLVVAARRIWKAGLRVRILGLAIGLVALALWGMAFAKGWSLFWSGMAGISMTS